MAMAKRNLQGRVKRGSGKRAGVRSALAIAAMSAIALGAGASGTTAQASIAPQEREGEARTYRIPAGAMANALNTFADMNGLQLLYDAGVTERIQTSGLVGQYSVKEGLDRLLSGTGLTYRFTSKHHTVSIVLAQNDTGAQTDANSAITLPTVDVTANQQGAPGGGGEGTGGGFGGAGPGQDPFNNSYVLPDASTGTKTDTPIMDTPLNVQSVSQQVLKDQQVITLDQALANVSNVSITNQTQFNGTPFSEIQIRGFGTSNIYRDGFRVDGGASNFLQFANIANIEVLKGAGAVLWGFSEPGGIININTNQPLDTPYYKASQQIGSFGNYRTTMDATGPLTEDKAWLYRFDMSYQNNAASWGYPSDFTPVMNLFLAPVIKWNIDGATWVKLEAQYLYSKIGYNFPFVPFNNGQFVPLARSLNYAESSPAVGPTLFSALSWSHQFPNDWTVKGQFSYFRSNTNIVEPSGFGFDSTNPTPTLSRQLEQLYETQTTYSTNVDLIGHIDTFGARHTLLLGGDFYKLTNYTLEATQNLLANSSPIAVWNPIHTGVPSFDAGGALFGSTESVNPQDTAGVYAQDQIELPYKFFVLAGARYQYIRQNGGLVGGTFPFGPGFSFPSTFAVNSIVKTADTEQRVTPRFGLLWRPQEWVSFYANFAQGFSANIGTIYPNIYAPPTDSTDAEAGVKVELFDGRLRATAAYYDLTKTNVTEPDPNPAHVCNGGGPGSCSLVVGAVRGKGPEVDIQGRILPGWDVIVAYSNENTEITKTNPGPDQTGTLGQPLGGVPRVLGSFWTTYDFQDETFRGLKIGGGVIYHGSQPYSTQPSGYYQYPYLSPYATVNLMSAYSFKLGESKVTAQVNVTNLLDHTYYTDAATNVPVGTPGLSVQRLVYGTPFSVIGSLSAELPGDASSPLSVPPPPRVPVFTWTGPYVGGQIGIAWGDNNGNLTFTTPGGLFGTYPLTGEASGVIGGAHVGYNLQINQAVIGVEGTVDGTNLNKIVLTPFADGIGPNVPLNPTTFLFPYGGTMRGSVHSDVQGSIRARAGYTWDRLLVYGTAGAAFAGFYSDFNIGGTDAPPGGNYYAGGTNAMVRVGWTAGGGVEYALNNNWSVQAEYRYSDFGRLTDVTPGFAFSTVRHLAQNQVETGFSYKFDSFPPDTGADHVGPAPFDFSQIRFSQVGPSQAGTAPAGAAPSLAAGLLSPPPLGPVNWTGFDLGFQVGYAWGDSNFNFTGFDSSAGSTVNSSVSSTRTGGIGGAHVGYNYQFDQWVAGVEGSVDVTSSLSTASFPAAFGGSLLTASTASNVQGSIRGRLGYAFDRALIYATAGVTIGDYTTSYLLIGNRTGNGGINGGNLVFGPNEFTNFPVGWTAGGGIEYAINDHWSARGEYRYTSFGTVSNAYIDGGALASTPGLLGSSLSASRRLNQNQVQAGFSYKFDSFDPAAADHLGATPAGAAPVRAADLPPPPPVPVITWTGAYLGGQIGDAWGDNTSNVAYATPGGLSGVGALVSAAQGVIGGAQAGYNYQIDQWVIGIKGTVDVTNLSRRVALGISDGGATDASGNLLGGTLAGIVRSNVQGSILGRAGFAWDRLLIYGTGGVALGSFSSQLTISGEDAAGNFYDDSLYHSTARAGWTAGGGVEYAINNNWSVTAEYRYSDFGHLIDTPAFPVAGLSYTANRHLLQNQMQFGFDYMFDFFAPPPVVAKY